MVIRPFCIANRGMATNGSIHKSCDAVLGEQCRLLLEAGLAFPYNPSLWLGLCIP